MMMRRINGVAAVVRAARGFAASSPASNNVAQERFHQAALYNTNCNYFTSSRSFSIDRSAHTCGGFAAQGVAGTMFFSVAASFAGDVHAKETNTYTKFAPNEVVLYQYEACPFCNKVKAFLDYNKIPYKVVEVNPISKKEIKWSDYKKVPILVVDGQQMVDSSVIIDQLSERLHHEVNSESLRDINEEERIWRRWVDDHLVHVLSPNIYRSPSEALESFDYITSQGNFSFFERMTGKYVGAAAMYFVSKKLKKKHNIIDERATLYEAAEKWMEALKGREFLGGENPNLADLAVFGVLRPIRYLQSGRDMVENTRIGEWYSRMEKIVGSARITA